MAPGDAASTSGGLSCVAVLKGHSDRAWHVAWSPDGRCLASSSGDKTTRIWVPPTAAQPGERGSDGDADGTGGGDGGWRCTAILEDAHTRTVRACSWSPNGRFLATASFDGVTGIWENDAGSWSQVATLEGHENEVKCVAWNPNGSLIATCGRDKSVWIWESIPGNEYECVDVKQGHSQDVKSVAWHPSGELLASCSYDDTVRLWTADGDDWACAQTLSGPGVGHTSSVWAVSFDPTGRRMVSCSADCTLKVWRATGEGSGQATMPWSLECTLSGHHTSPVYCCDWSAAGVIAAGDGDNRIKVYARPGSDGGVAGDGPSWLPVADVEQAHGQDVNCVKWNPSDSRLLASAGDDGLVKVWRTSGLLAEAT